MRIYLIIFLAILSSTLQGQRGMMLPSTTVTYFWDNVGTYPSTTYPATTVFLPNSKGIGSLNTGSLGWETNNAFIGNPNNSVTHTYERYPGRASLYIVLEPNNPIVPTLPSGDGTVGSQPAANYRTEISLGPWHYTYAVPSEMWFSWSYYFPTVAHAYDGSTMGGDGLIHQWQSSQRFPNISIWQYYSTNPTYFSNRLLFNFNYGDANSPGPTESYWTSGQQPLVAGKWMDFIEHIIWDNTGTAGQPGKDTWVTKSPDSQGLYECWVIVDGIVNKLCTYSGPNCYTLPRDGNPIYAPTPKLGNYHYSWHTANTAVPAASIAAGYDKGELYLGPVRIIYNLPGHFNSNGFYIVKP
jgi:hypothetical protein